MPTAKSAEPECLDDERHPELDAVEPGRQPEVDQGQAEHLPTHERGEHLSQAVALRGIGLLAAQPVDEPIALLAAQPVCLRRRTGQVAERGEADEDRRQGLLT
jgi:hypothetical protein